MKAPRSRAEHPFNHFLNRRLVSYATAAAAAGAGLAGFANPAEAEIVYTPTHAVVSTHASYALDLTNSGTTDFIIHGSLSANCSTVFSALLARPVAGNAVEGADFDGLNIADALRPGETIGSSQRFAKIGKGGVLMGEVINSPGGGQYRGNWVHVVSRYLGLKFQINGQTHFGWARVSVAMSFRRPLQAVISGYAYETLANTPIVAGQETGQSRVAPSAPAIKGEHASLAPPESPQPATLGALALGAQGLSLWRRERPASAA